jgi:hypothetical protein
VRSFAVCALVRKKTWAGATQTGLASRGRVLSWDRRLCLAAASDGCLHDPLLWTAGKGKETCGTAYLCWARRGFEGRDGWLSRPAWHSELPPAPAEHPACLVTRLATHLPGETGGEQGSSLRLAWKFDRWDRLGLGSRRPPRPVGPVDRALAGQLIPDGYLRQ